VEKNSKKTNLDLCERIINEKLEKYEAVCRSFAPFFNDANLQERFAQKLDAKVLDKINKEKATKDDVNGV